MNIPMSIKTFGGPVVGRAMLRVQKYAPEILTGVGIVGGVAAAVMGAKATLKLEEVLEAKDNRTEILAEIREHKSLEEYTEQEHMRDKVGIYGRFTVDLMKLYGPSVSLGVASIVSIVCAHGIMRRRNVALMAAYKTVETAFSQYRARVIEEFGADKDADFRAGVFTKEVTDKETGKKKQVKTIDTDAAISGYARFFDETCSPFQKDPEYNLMFLRRQQDWANDLLRLRGYVFLNEVYDSLGIPMSQEGQVVGWVLEKNGVGDNYIDFNIYNGSERGRAFVNGLERAILLDFNVDGVILDKI